ncbi:MAG TPA: diguanylate cyclase [Caulobacteraceae bacterium]|jgi:diguanylate cyclase (GGDEF)-like protein
MAKDQHIAADPEVLRLTQELDALRQELRAMGERLAESERLADHDVLTPLLNRRAFVREVQRAIALTRRHDTPASVIYFDLDDFKGVNDCFGHAAGDAVLIAVAGSLLANVREADAVGRIGGDEFAVLLLHADLKAAQAKAAALAAAVSELPVEDAGGMRVSLTWGARQIGAVDSAEQALSEADAAMYLRKPLKGG